MLELDNRLKKLNKQFKLVAVKVQKLEVDNKDLANKNQKLQQKLDELSKITTVNNQTKKELEKIDKEGIDNKDLSKIKSELNQYILEIEKCIEWIQNN